MGLPRAACLGREYVDWEAAEAQVKGMSTEALNCELRMTRDAVAAADEMDRANGTTRGGLLRDEISILRREIGRRLLHGVTGCPTCGK